MQSSLEENRLVSHPVCIEPETNQSPNMKLNEISKPLPNGKEISIPVNLSNHEMIDDHALEKYQSRIREKRS